VVTGPEQAYLQSLRRAGIPVSPADQQVILWIGHGVCAQQAQGVSHQQMAQHIRQVFPGHWTPGQATALISCAAMYLCM
jgi:hypothetical protein